MVYPTDYRPAGRAMRGTAAVALTALMLLLTPILPGFAQEQMAAPGVGTQDDQNASDPPGRVGRLAKLDGSVSFHAADDDQWQPASLNWPVAQGNSFWTEPGARAVIELGGARVGVDGGTEVDIQQLDYQTVLVNVPQGSVFVRVRDLEDDQQVLIATPGGTVQLLTGGRYHIDAGGNGNPGLVSVHDGEAALVGQGEPVMFGTGEAGAIMLSNAPPPMPAAPQAIDAWADVQAAPPPTVAAYLPPDMPGAADLAYVGTWGQVPGYGNVWFPPVAADWAPYRYGHWAFVRPWGWTWVDDAAWGFAPFHYGRWAQIDGRWGWIPGEVVAQPVYAPALVTFVGGGGWTPGVAVGVGLAVGWIPLGPQEIYRPWYHTSDAYFRHVNVTNVTNINTITLNNYSSPAVDHFRNYQHATVVDAGAMTSSQPVSRALLKVPPQALAQAPISHGQVPVKPSAATVGANPNIVRKEGGDLNAHPAWKPAPGPMQGGKPRVVPTTNLTAIKPLPPSGHPGTGGNAPRGGFGGKAGAPTGQPPTSGMPSAPGSRPGTEGTVSEPGGALKQPVVTPGGQPSHPQAAPTGTAAPGTEFKKPMPSSGQPSQPPAGTAAPGPQFNKPATPPGSQPGQPQGARDLHAPGGTGSPAPQGNPQVNRPPPPPPAAPPVHPQGGGTPANAPASGAGHPAPKEPPPKCDPKVQKCP